MAAVSDTITVLLVYMLATRLIGDRRAGLIAALLSALAVIQIQNAHYTAVDAPMTMFIVATVYFSVRLVQDRKPSDAILSGVMLGLAIATKVSAAPVALAVLTAHLILAIGESQIRGIGAGLGRRTARKRAFGFERTRRACSTWTGHIARIAVRRLGRSLDRHRVVWSRNLT